MFILCCKHHFLLLSDVCYLVSRISHVYWALKTLKTPLKTEDGVWLMAFLRHSFENISQLNKWSSSVSVKYLYSLYCSQPCRYLWTFLIYLVIFLSCVCAFSALRKHRISSYISSSLYSSSFWLVHFSLVCELVSLSFDIFSDSGYSTIYLISECLSSVSFGFFLNFLWIIVKNLASRSLKIL